MLARSMQAGADLMDERHRMLAVDPVAARHEMVDGLVAQSVLHDARVAEAMRAVPREAFALDVQTAYEDAPQPIGAGQTISAPHMVAMMTEALDVRPGQRILEVGGGSGYHAAVLAHLGARVVSVEIVPELAARARAALSKLDIFGVTLVVGDGSEGHPPSAPYDRISVACGAPEIPRALVEQLAPDGFMVIPVGPLGQQTLLRVDARGESVPLMAVRFVPLVGKHGWKG